MFTGIIEELGIVKLIDKKANSAKINISAEFVNQDLNIGDSVAVNGVCLTIIEYSSSHLVAEIMHETLARTSMKNLKSGDKVNLERALRADSRLGGHIVSGHIDGVGKIISKQQDGIAEVFDISYPPEIGKYLAKKGSVAVDGISLTIVEITNEYFRLSLIPHSLKSTTLGFKKQGDLLNIEIDVLARYIESLFTQKKNNERESKMSENFLIENGFMWGAVWNLFLIRLKKQ